MQSTRFVAMGAQCHVVVVDGVPDALDDAIARVAELEARWSRFRPDSELCRLNAAAGRPVLVSRETLAAIRRACQAWRNTGGAFDPTVLGALEQAGYDRPFAELPATAPRHAHRGATARRGPTPGCSQIVIDPIVGAVTLPAGVRLDLGAIGKGLAADIVAADLVAAGARGALVSLGGDLRVLGAAPTPRGWTIALPGDLGAFTIAGGGVATSAVTRRRWSIDGRDHHHVIDPRTGESATSTSASVSVIAPTAAEAEVLATSALLAGDGAIELLEANQASGVAVAHDGQLRATADLEALAA